MCITLLSNVQHRACCEHRTCSSSPIIRGSPVLGIHSEASVGECAPWPETKACICCLNFASIRISGIWCARTAYVFAWIQVRMCYVTRRKYGHSSSQYSIDVALPTFTPVDHFNAYIRVSANEPLTSGELINCYGEHSPMMCAFSRDHIHFECLPSSTMQW